MKDLAEDRRMKTKTLTSQNTYSQYCVYCPDIVGCLIPSKMHNGRTLLWLLCSRLHRCLFGCVSRAHFEGKRLFSFSCSFLTWYHLESSGRNDCRCNRQNNHKRKQNTETIEAAGGFCSSEHTWPQPTHDVRHLHTSKYAHFEVHNL